MTLTDRLAAFALAPVAAPEAREVMTQSLLDWAACALAAREEPVARLLRDKALAEGGAKQATMVGGGQVPAPVAALVNGATSHALDYDDTHFAHIGHPSVAVLPAALAIAEREGRPLSDTIDAALVGVEASVRVGVWLGRGHYQTGFHQTGTAGAFGATLAAGRLLGLDAATLAQAVGLASTRASGLKNQFGTMGKPLNAGLAAETGVQAALWAQAGLTSAEDGLAGPQGFGATHHGAGEVAEALAGLGEDWLFAGVSHKFHACCHGLHAMLEALAGTQVDPGAIEAVAVRTHPRWLSVCNIAEPRTGLEAKFSYRLTAAMALSGRDTGAIGSFSADTATDPALTALRDRVTVTGDDSLGETQSAVTLRLADGTARELSHDLSDPLAPEVRAGKLARKAESLVGTETAAALRHAIAVEDRAALVALLAG